MQYVSGEVMRSNIYEKIGVKHELNGTTGATLALSGERSRLLVSLFLGNPHDDFICCSLSESHIIHTSFAET